MANTTNFNWETPDDTDLVKDGALAIRTLGSAIDTSMMDLKGGTTGQFLSKNSNTDMDFVWAASSGIPATIVDAKGDLIVATAADTVARLASSGTNGQVLTVDTSATTGLKWANGAKILQVVQASTNTATTSTTQSTYVDTGLSASITPSATTSKILVIVNQQLLWSRSDANMGVGWQLLRGSTVINNMPSDAAQYYAVGTLSTPRSFAFRNILSMTWLDSPSTTSSTTYKTQGTLNAADNSPSITFQSASAYSTMTLIEVAG